MPEQLTKHPEVTLYGMSAAAVGEMCIYGLPEARSMTQITEASCSPTLTCHAGLDPASMVER